MSLKVSLFWFYPGVPRLYIAKVTCWITILITVQRCLCIAWPLKVKSALTPTKTACFIAAICIIFYFFIAFPVTGTGAGHFGWVFSEVTNRTLLSFIYTSRWIAVSSAFLLINTWWQLISFLTITCCNGVLVFQLKKKTKRRGILGVAGEGKLESLSRRDRKLARKVITLSVTFIVCWAPSVATYLQSLVTEVYDLKNGVSDLSRVMWNISALFEAIHASGTIIVYHKMSSKYRQTLASMCCHRSTVK